MKYKNIGQSRIKASRIFLGSWAIGGWMWGGTDEDEAINAIESAIDNGINAIDTAPIYGFGESEKIIGKAIKGKRDKVIVATKCGLVWNTDKGERGFRSNQFYAKKDGEIEVRKYLGKESIYNEVDNSLLRLKTDYIDLYQTHWQDGTTPIAETMEALLRCKEQGKIREIGVCNATVEQIMEYKKYGNIVSDQERFNMIDREAEISNLGYCKNSKTSFLAFSPLSYGLLSGNILPTTVYGVDDIRYGQKRFERESIENINSVLKKLGCYCEKYMISYSSLALAWVMNKKGSPFVLAGSRKSAHVLENIKAGDIIIEEDDMKKINSIITEFSVYRRTKHE